jgi:hypothetical protein
MQVGRGDDAAAQIVYQEWRHAFGIVREADHRGHARIIGIVAAILRVFGMSS